MLDVLKFDIDNVRMDENILKTKFKKREYPTFTKYKYNFFDSELFSDRKKNTDEGEEADSNKSKSYKQSHHYIYFIIKNGEKTGKLYFNQNIRRNWIDYKKAADKKGIEYTDIIPRRPLMPRVMADLSYYNFIKIIELYAEELAIPKNIFWGANVTQVELGVNLRFPTNIKTKNGVEKMSLQGMLSSFGTLKNVPEKDTYGRSGVRFKADAFEISIYDKLKRIIFTKEIFKNKKESVKVKRRKKINEIHHFIRYELRVKEVSSFRRESFAGKLNTLKDIKDNWDLLLTSLFGTTEDIDFVDFLSPEIENELILSQLDSKSKSLFYDYLIYQGVKKIGYTEFIRDIVPLVNIKTRREFQKEVDEIYDEFRNKNPYNTSYEKMFLDTLNKRLDSLKIKPLLYKTSIYTL
ncbi:hypothetical protein [Chryseobacterium sp. RU33C]|uniref:hypothetical protein n=1 Tax=Chryseobacterium sp. RU33C TaxID=1907398 RepID=UPI00095668E4|nr:hypothetical protein [Chryseobacterium sp. RU33C]SIQ77316.1 hypothetical protein SAMN05880573_11034 [Chryseobacterium sp. RU33C]